MIGIKSTVGRLTLMYAEPASFDSSLTLYCKRHLMLWFLERCSLANAMQCCFGIVIPSVHWYCDLMNQAKIALSSPWDSPIILALARLGLSWNLDCGWHHNEKVDVSSGGRVINTPEELPGVL